MSTYQDWPHKAHYVECSSTPGGARARCVMSAEPCDWRVDTETYADARAEADLHAIVTHGSTLPCGTPNCPGDRAIRSRARAARRLAEHTERRIVDAQTAAFAIGVSVRTVRRWVSAGTLTNHGTASGFRIDLAELRNEPVRRAIRAAFRA